MKRGAASSRIRRRSSGVQSAMRQMLPMLRSKAAKYASSRSCSPNAALLQIHSPIRLGHTSASTSFMRKPTWVPKYMNSENGWAAKPCCARNGASSPRWNEGWRADSVGMLTSATGFSDGVTALGSPGCRARMSRARLLAAARPRLRRDLGDGLGPDRRLHPGADLRPDLGPHARMAAGSDLGADLGSPFRTDLGSNLGLDLRLHLGTDPRTDLRASLWSCS